MRIVRIAAISLLAVGLAAGIACGGEEDVAAPLTTQTPTGWEVWVTEDDAGTIIALKMEDSLIVALDSNPSTGYSWSLVSISDTSVIEKVHDEYKPEPTPEGTPLVGAGGEEIWTFVAVGAGTSTIEMMYSRPWESVEPAARFNITVTVE